MTLASAIDMDGFRAACRRLWAEQVEPARVAWHAADDAEGDLFESGRDAGVPAAAAGRGGAGHVPAAFLPLCESVVLHRDPGRFGLLYRLLWRLQHEPGLRHDPLDPDWVARRQMAQAVRRDMHKMKAFVRFRALDEGAGGGPLHVAWFEPEHHIVEATAPFFARRFAAMHWAILTPGAQRALGRRAAARSARGARRDQAPPADAGEALWLTYYQQHLQSGAPQAGDDGKGDARQLLGQPAGGGVDRAAGRRRGASEALAMIAARPRPTRKRRIRRRRRNPRPAARRTAGGEAPTSLPALREALDALPRMPDRRARDPGGARARARSTRS